MTDKEGEEANKGRFYVESYEGCWQSGWRLVDSITGEEVGRDGGEPEDQILVRDWAWVQAKLNTMAETEEALRGLALELLAELDRVPQYDCHPSEGQHTPDCKRRRALRERARKELGK